MALQLSVAVQNARLDAIETTIGATAKLLIYSGSAPANCAAAATGTLLATLTLPSDWMSAASSGDKAKTGTWTGTASGGSATSPTHFRLAANDGTTIGLQGTAGVGSGDLSFDGTITSGQTITISGFTLTDAND
ncbi:MAG: hypothetical protein E6Q97_15415 [Desulfurellales bacterium]|nr:MAG: hypothetical protein E6Q97_15415 [Desulfurellales bacterium]